MPFDNEGVFSRIHNWEDDRINDIDIVTDHMDEEDDNFADGLSHCLLKNGNSKMEANLNVGNFKITNLADGTLSSDAVNRGQLDSNANTVTTSIKEIINAMVKVGDIKASAMASNHDNWLLCNGQAVSRTDYADLFAIIGTNFGAGNGVTTFNVPDYRGKFLRGLGGDSSANIYTPQAEGLPNLVYNIGYTGTAGNGNPDGGADLGGYMYPRASDNIYKKLDASTINSIYGASAHVTPTNYAVNWFIKAKKE